MLYLRARQPDTMALFIAQSFVLALANQFYPDIDTSSFIHQDTANPPPGNNFFFTFSSGNARIYVKLTVEGVPTGLKLWSLEVFSGQQGRAPLYFWPEKVYQYLY